MAENIRNTKLRLNLDKPEDRRANEILSSSGRSMSQFIIAAVNAYGSYLDEDEAKRHFVQQVNDSLRKTFTGRISRKPSTATPPGNRSYSTCGRWGTLLILQGHA